MVRFKPLPCFNSSSVKNNHLKCSHQTSHISLSIILCGRMMIDLTMIILRIIQQSHHFTAKSMSQSNRERSKVFMKRVISKFFISIKVKGVIIRSRWSVTRDPIQLVFNDFNGSAVNLVVRVRDNC